MKKRSDITEAVRMPSKTLNKIRRLIKSKKSTFSTIQHFIDYYCKTGLEEEKNKCQMLIDKKDISKN